MTVIINTSTGAVSYTYPQEYQDEINLYKRPGFEELYAAFQILDAVYNYEKKYKVAIRPYWAWGGDGDNVWRYRITSPLINQRIYIKERQKDLTPNVARTEMNPCHDYTTEYQMNIGKLFETSNCDGVFAYLCRLFTEPAKQKYLAEPGRYQKLEQRRRSGLITLANDIVNMQH